MRNLVTRVVTTVATLIAGTGLRADVTFLGPTP